ncbi:MAG: T9SS type A sorting domain-containing protein [Ignavibacteriales bacterium]|nr:T9SS type A sorting domain-containing protein [Ignavibacteriales bacterium]
MKFSTLIAVFFFLSFATRDAAAESTITAIPTGVSDSQLDADTMHIELKILLVQFTDIECKKDSESGLPLYTAKNFEDLLGSEGMYVSPKMHSPDGDEIFGSMNDYFRIMSGGRVRLHATVINRSIAESNRPLWITLRHTKQYYHADYNFPVFDDALDAARKSGLDVSTSEDTRLAIIYAGNAWMNAGLNPLRWGGSYIMSELQGRPYNQEASHPRFSRIGLHCHEFAHTLGVVHSSGSRADLMESGVRNGSIEGNAPAPLNALARMRLGWAQVISVQDSSIQTVVVSYSLTDPTYVKMKNNRGDLFVVDNRRFDQCMMIGDTKVPDYNNAAFFPPAWGHASIRQGMLVWRVNGIDSIGDPAGYSAEGLIYASGRYGRTYPEGNPSETDDGVPFPGVSNRRILSPSSDPRSPYTTEPNFFETTKSHYTLFVPNTTRGSNASMEIVFEDSEQGTFTVRFSLSNSANHVLSSSSAEIVLPSSYVLFQNYPNPFNPSTTIRFALPKDDHVTLKIFDLLGKEVATLVSQDLGPGYFTVRWLANVPSGTYFYQLRTNESVETKKMILTR